METKNSSGIAEEIRNMQSAFDDIESPFAAFVRQHGPNIGYGRMMQLISQIWHEKDPVGAFVVGPCYKQVEVYGDYFELVDDRRRFREENRIAEQTLTVKDDTIKHLEQVVERLTKERDDAHLKFGRATLAHANAVRKHQKTTFQIQQRREELEQVETKLSQSNNLLAYKDRDIESLRSKLAAVKEKEFIACSKHHEFIADIERLETELAEKDKVLEPLREFVKAVIRIAFDGGSLNGGDIQEMGVRLRLLDETKYDPEKHGESEYADPGDPWYVFSDILTATINESKESP